MERNIEDHGRMGSNMEKDCFIVKKEMFGKKEFGKMEKEPNG